MSGPGAAVAAGRSRTRFTPRAAILTVIVIGLMFYLLVPLKEYMAQRSRLQNLTHQMQTLESQNAGLEAKVVRLQDPAYLEQLARECLGMVKPGEIPFLIVPKGGAPPPRSC
jgi:cell division protein FtsB